MKSAMVTFLLALAVVSPSLAADLKVELVDLEKKGWNAWYNRDAKEYADLMADGAMQVASGGVILNGREQIMATLDKETCSLKKLDISDTKLRQPSPDTAILTYTATQDVQCEGQAVPPKVFSTACTFGRTVAPSIGRAAAPPSQ